MSPRRLALFDAYPQLEAKVPWLPLVDGPTPVGSCDAIAAWLGRRGVAMKRDDMAGPLYGGNKVRRFEFVLADAKAKGATELVTSGGLASTQMIATVLYGRQLGFDVTAVLFDQPVTDFARRAVRIGHANGARLVHGGGYVKTAWLTARAAMRKDTYLLLPGASSPLANLGYVDAMFELAAQVERGELARPDKIVLPTGSGGTLAGLAVGASLLGWDTEIVGVRITDLIACNRFTIGALVAATTRFLKARVPGLVVKSKPRTRLFHGAIGGGYGHPTEAALAATAEVERLLGVPGEVTYSAKGLVGLREVVRVSPREQILYWQTLSSRAPDLPDVELPPQLDRALR